MSGKQRLGNRRKIIEIGNSVGVTLPSEGIEELDVSREELKDLELPATIREDGKFVVDLTEAERELKKFEQLQTT